MFEEHPRPKDSSSLTPFNDLYALPIDEETSWPNYVKMLELEFAINSADHSDFAWWTALQST